MNNTNNNLFVDRSQFESGPWDDEPDKVQWTTKANLPGLVVRNYMGALCGYAAVTSEHALYKVDYKYVNEYCDVTVHGDLTYANTCQDNGPICHVPEPGEPDDVWWFGFDCAHGSDIIPMMGYHTSVDIDRLGYKIFYRDIGYVTDEVESLASQLADIKP